MFYYLYEIRNNLNGKIYVGVHKTKDINDGYMGSGKVVKRAIEKHGLDNFTKVILETFDDEESMYLREKEVVSEHFLLRDDTYNIRRGGLGGFDHINNNPAYLEGKRRGGYTTTNSGKNPFLNADWQNKNNLFRSNRSIQQLGNSPEVRLKAIKKAKDTYATINHQSGEKNSQFGTMWITDGESNKKISKTAPIPNGWQRGRIR